MVTSALFEKGKNEEPLHVLLALTFNGKEAVSLQYPDSVKIHRYASW